MRFVAASLGTSVIHDGVTQQGQDLPSTRNVGMSPGVSASSWNMIMVFSCVMLCVGLFTWVFGSVFVVEELLGADF